jgi:hypothetical protein
MTVNIYFLYCTANAVPDGWTEIAATYHNRLIKLTGSSWKTTAGTDTHTHTVTTNPTWTNGGTSNSLGVGTSYNVAYTNHTHTHTSMTIDAGTDTNLPLYKNYRMIYRDVTTFNGQVPAYAGCIRGALPTSGIDYDHWAWDNNTDSYIRIAATYGGTGGANSHVHPVTSVIANALIGGASKGAGAGVFVKGTTNHSHDMTGKETDSTAHTYQWWGGGVMKVSQVTNALPATSYCWFDGTVPAGWTAINSSYNGYFCRNRGSAARTVTTGGDDATHNHTFSATTGSATGTSQTAETGANAGLLFSHVHTQAIAGTYVANLPVPSNFTLQVASNDAEINPTVTRTKTYAMNILLKQSHLENYTSDLLIKKMGIQKTYLMDLLIKKNGLTKSVDMDILVRKTCLKSLVMDILLKKLAIIKSYQMDLLLSKFLLKTYQVDILLQQTMNKSISVDILLKKSIISTYSMNIIIINIIGKQKQYEMDILLKKLAIIKSYQMDLLLSKFLLKTYQVDILLQQTMNKSISVDILLKKSIISTYSMNIIIINIIGKQKQYEMDIIIKRLGLINTYEMNLLIKRFNLTKTYAMDLIISSGSGSTKSYSMGIILSIPFNDYRQRRELHMDSQLQPVEITRGHDNYNFDPIGNEPRQKRDILAISKHTASTEMTKGFDPFVHDDIPRKKREFSNAS